MTECITFNETNVSFKYVRKQFNNIDFYGQKRMDTPTIGIGIQYVDSEFIFPSPLTNFITSYAGRKGKSLNTQYKLTSEIVRFLNFCIKQINIDDNFAPLKKGGFFELDLIHGSKFISYLTARTKEEIEGQPIIQGSYVFEIEKYLILFYQWLSIQKIVNIEELETDRRGNFIRVEEANSPFDSDELGTMYPVSGKLIPNKAVDFGDNRLSLTYRFIQLSENIAPEISLGLCYQFFGGLRLSEIVNLTRKSLISPTFSRTISNTKNMLINVKDNQTILFPDSASLVANQVKRPRKQLILPFPIITKTLNRHINELKIIEKKIQINKEALFIHPKSGKALTSRQYYRRFNKVKLHFMKELSEECHPSFDFLNERPWSTHIGRGVFTNIVLDRGADVISTSIIRGDKTLDAVMSYIDQRRAYNLTQEAIHSLPEELKKQREEKVKSAFGKKEAIIDLTPLGKFD